MRTYNSVSRNQAGCSEQRPADGGELVEREEEEGEGADAQGQDKRCHEHAEDEQAMDGSDCCEPGEYLVGVLIHPQQD
jgi:hypothetical protein